MKFNVVEPDENFPLGRLVSDDGRWEVGFYPVIFGVRVRLGRVGALAVDLDYCAGADPALRWEILLLVLRILAPVPEDKLCESFLKKTFPGWKIRPIDRDDFCLPRLRVMASAADDQADDK